MSSNTNTNTAGIAIYNPETGKIVQPRSKRKKASNSNENTVGVFGSLFVYLIILGIAGGLGYVTYFYVNKLLDNENDPDYTTTTATDDKNDNDDNDDKKDGDKVPTIPSSPSNSSNSKVYKILFWIALSAVILGIIYLLYRKSNPSDIDSLRNEINKLKKENKKLTEVKNKLLDQDYHDSKGKSALDEQKQDDRNQHIPELKKQIIEQVDKVN